MTRKTNVRVVAFPKTQYDKEWLDTLKHAELSEAACADGDSEIWTLEEFQDKLHEKNANENIEKYWIFFLNN